MMFTEIIQLCDNNIELANAKSRNYFFEEAVKFYVSYLNAEHYTSFLTETIESVIKSSIQVTEDKLAKVLFILTVETGMMSITGASFEIYDISVSTILEILGVSSTTFFR